MPNVRAANKVKIGAWVDRSDAANLRQYAASQGLHVSTLIESAVIRSLPMIFTRSGADEAQAEEGTAFSGSLTTAVK
jgi:hypothetical protein